jgi:hypothetical protein
MKKLLLLFLLAFSLNAYSQIEKPITKGNIMLSGGGSISHIKSALDYANSTSKTSYTNVSFTPGASYFIIDRLAIGLNTTITYNGLKNNKSVTLGLGPKVKYYFNNGLFINAETGFNYLHGLSNTSYKIKYLSFKPGFGYAIFLNQKVSLEPGVFYEFSNNKYDSSYGPESYKNNIFSIELKLNLFL